MKGVSLITRGTIDHAHLHEAMKELREGSDRAVAIVGATLVETMLKDALLVHLNRNETLTNDLFKTTGALGPFATKIHIGFLVGLFGETAYKDLLWMKDIRNAFAHKIDVTDFKSQRMKNLAENFKLCDRYSADIETDRDPNPTLGTKPKDFMCWVYIDRRDEALKNARERYIIEVQVLSWSLALHASNQMPEPLF